MAKKVGALIKEARTKAGLTQEQLAKRIRGLSANDISKAERGEKELTQEQLKAIAKVTGVTQKSLLEAAKGKASGSSASSSGGKTASIRLTAAEKKLVELYREAEPDAREAALKALRGKEEAAGSILESLTGGDHSVLGNLLENAIGALTGKNGTP